jgi:hypothetical protein
MFQFNFLPFQRLASVEPSMPISLSATENQHILPHQPWHRIVRRYIAKGRRSSRYVPIINNEPWMPPTSALAAAPLGQRLTDLPANFSILSTLLTPRFRKHCQ